MQLFARTQRDQIATQISRPEMPILQSTPQLLQFPTQARLIVLIALLLRRCQLYTNQKQSIQ